MKPIVHRWAGEYSSLSACGLRAVGSDYAPTGLFIGKVWKRGDRRCKRCEKALGRRK